MANDRLKIYVNGAWRDSAGAGSLAAGNPATAEVLVVTPFSTPAEVDRAAQAAALAFEGWRRTPATQRIQYLFKWP